MATYFQVNGYARSEKFNSCCIPIKIYTKLKTKYRPIIESSQVENSQFASGSIIRRYRKRFLVSRQAFVHSDAVVENAILMANNDIGEGAVVRHAILDKNVAVKQAWKSSGPRKSSVWKR